MSEQKAKKRPRVIQIDENRLQLWIRSGGICEMPGCGNVLWRDALTLKPGFYGEAAHIIGKKSSGPRGDKERSEKLAYSPDNLILLCRACHRHIDKDHPEDYPEESLLEFKKNHEIRVHRLLSIPEDRKRTVLIFKANIQKDQVVSIPFGQIQNFLLSEGPYYAEERGVAVDLTDKSPPESDLDWKELRNRLEDNLKKELKPYLDGKRQEHFAVFAIGPIPLLITLGRGLPNALPIDLYQRCRTDHKWILGEKVSPGMTFTITTPKAPKNDRKKIALKLSVSGAISDESVSKALDEDLPIYTIQLQGGIPGMTMAADDVKKFGVEFRKILSLIQESHGDDVNLHLFPAIPNALAVQCGISLVQKAHPPILIYDYNRALGGFQPTFNL